MVYRPIMLAIGLAASFAAPARSDDIFPIGVWTDTRSRMVVRIAPCGATANTFCGTVVQDNRSGRAINPQGHMIVRHVQPSASGWRGQALDVNSRVDFTLQQRTNDRANLRLCLIGVLCFDEKVERISSLASVMSLPTR